VAKGLVINARLEGFDELRARLDYFPDRMRNNFLRGGARAAGAVLARRLKARLSADGLRTAAGSVRTSVRLQGGPTATSVRGVVQYGGRYQSATGRGEARRKVSRDAWYAHILEWGAKPHEIRARPGHTLALGPPLRDFRRKVKHPGIVARLYATRTAAQDMPAANRAFENYVEARVARFWSSGR
jgi:hypothetical protein